MTKAATYAWDILSTIISWLVLLLLVWIYNLVSLIIPNFYLGLLTDLLIIAMFFVVLGWSRDEQRKIVIKKPPVYSFFCSLTFGLLVTPIISNQLGISDQSLTGFVILVGLVSGCQLYLESLLENTQTWFYKLSKGYAWLIITGLLALVVNYRLKVYFDITLLPDYDHISQLIMTNSVTWIFNNV